MSVRGNYDPIFYESHRLDSWDMENLAYIRKKSQNHNRLLLEECSLPEDELSSIEHEQYGAYQSQSKHPFSPWEGQYEEEKEEEYFNHHQSQVPFQSHVGAPDVDPDAEEDAKLLTHDKDINIDTNLPTQEIDDELDFPSLLDPNRNRLDDCYLLDVLTIGNDSVLKDIGVANDTEETCGSISKVPTPTKTLPLTGSILSPTFFSKPIRQRQPPRKISGGTGQGSLGTASNSPSTSSAEDEAETEYFLASSSISSRADEGDCFQSDLSSPESCLLCSDDGSSRGSTSRHFYGETGSLQKRSLSQIRGRASANSRTPEIEWQGNSPYYVKLRRDLPLPSMTPPPNTPTRFGVDKKGHLVIDYSHNWTGLERYIKQLHLA